MVYDKIKKELKQNPKTWIIAGDTEFIGPNLIETLLTLKQKFIRLNNFETGHNYNIKHVKSNSVNFDNYKSIVMAVFHNKYKTLTFENKEQIIYKIKSILRNTDGRL